MKKILVVVDMQNDFIDGALGTREAEGIVERVVSRIHSYKGNPVFATRDTHGPDYMETSEGRHLPVPHCIKGTWGWKIQKQVGEALSRVQAQIIDKPTFGSLLLVQRLYEMSLEEELEIELTGLCTDICVVSNALLLKAQMPETVIKINPACCAGVTPESHQAALLTMKMCQVEITGDLS